jgi:SprA family protein
VLSVISIKAPRPAVDWHSTADGVERPPADALLPADKVSLSPEARELARAEARRGVPGAPRSSGGGQDGGLAPEQQRKVQELKQRDRHVRAHEAAHQAAGGDLTGPASFSYQLGPDGRSYAVGGEVPVQSRSGRTPDETIAIARRVRAAALAPSDPSGADLAAAASASQVELRAMQQKRQQGQDGVARAAQAGQVRGGAGAAAGAPTSTPRADLERLIVRAPEAEPFM